MNIIALSKNIFTEIYTINTKQGAGANFLTFSMLYFFVGCEFSADNS